MPKYLEQRLMAEYGPHSTTPYKIMNKMGVMSGPNETPKGAAMQRQHDAKVAGTREGRAAALASHPHAARLGKYLHPRKAR